MHGACPIWKGEKVAATLWIRRRGQDLFYSSADDWKEIILQQKEAFEIPQINVCTEDV